MPHRISSIPGTITAITPVLATITLEHYNTALSAVTGTLALAYFLWRWRREARREGKGK